MSKYVDELCNTKTINEQREVWQNKLRPVLLSWWVSWGIVGNEKFLWKALGVPGNQRDMIVDDYYRDEDEGFEDEGGEKKQRKDRGGKAIWDYVVNTLDPVVEASLIAEDNYFYGLCLKGCYTTK